MDLYGNMAEALPGLLYGVNPRTVGTRVSASAQDFGKPLFLTSAGAIQATPASGAKFVGISVFTQKEGGEYKAKDAINVLEQGTIWVEVDEDTTPAEGGTVYVDADGKFVAVAGTSPANTAITAKFRGTKNDDNLVLIEVQSIY